jgi:hypothetical protein
VSSGRVLIGGNIAFWAALWWLGVPMPNDDDLFFVGPALELVDGGRLANPLIRFWHPEAAQTFFFQPPFFQHVLAAWLSAFGVSAGSMTGLQCVMGAVASTSGGGLLRRLGLAGAWFVPVAIGAMALTKGMRHDLLGLALLFTGLWLLSARGRASMFAGIAVLFAAPLTWPVMACYAVPLGLAILARQGRLSRAALPELIAGSAVAGLVVLALFLVSIDFAVSDFLRLFAWHADIRRVPGLFGDLPLLLTRGRSEITHGPVYVLTAGLMAVALIRYRRAPLLAGTAAAVLAALILNIVGYSSTWQTLSTHIIVLTMGILALNMINELQVQYVPLVSAAVVGVTMWSSALAIVTLLAIRPESAQYYQQVAARIPADKCLGVDAVAARYVFDYRLPPCAYASHYSFPSPKFFPREGDAPPPGAAWVTSQAPGGHTSGVPPEDRLVLFGWRFDSIPKNYWRIRIVP